LLDHHKEKNDNAASNLVDISLDNGSPNHGSGTGEESSSHPLDPMELID